MMIGLGAGIDYSLLIIGRYREQRAAGDDLQDAAARAAATSGTTVVAAGPDRDGGDRRPAGRRRPVHREDGPRRGDRGRRGGRVGADDPADHDRRLRPQAGAEEARARPGLAGLHPLGRDRHPPAVGVDRRRRRGAADLRVPGHADAHRPARRRQPGRVAHAARRLRPAHRGVRPGLQRPVPARRRHAEGRAGDRAAAERAPAGGRRHARHRHGASGGGQRGRRDGDDLRDPDHRAAGRQDLRPARPPARGRHPAGDRRHAAEGLRRRQRRRLRGHSPTRSPGACRCSSRS